jgi:hypothetical protein
MRYNYRKLQTIYTLQTIKGGGHAPRVPQRVALECASILAAGYMQQCYLVLDDRVLICTEHVCFTSI